MNELTIAQFITAWAAANDEPENKVKEKVWKWVQTGHLPTHKVPNETGILVTTADPATFQFVDLEDPERTVYTLAELKALDTKQDWIAF